MRQTLLFTPGDKEGMITKALSSEADMVILDIEDAVAPAAKDKAGRTIERVLSAAPKGKITVDIAVRVNSFDTRAQRDVDNILGSKDKIEQILLPKVRGVESIERLNEVLDENDFDAGIVPVIETPESLVSIFDIASYPGVEAIAFGAEDLTTKLGASHTNSRTEILYARQKLVIAAGAADVDAIDMAWPDFTDEEGLRRNTRQAVGFGYDGKPAIHPAQIEIIKEEFAPDDAEIEWAQEIVAEAEKALEKNNVVFQLDGEMIDPAIIDRARAILRRAE